MKNNRSDYALRMTLLALLGLLFIIFGTIGFYQYYSKQNAVYSWLDCFYLSLQLIPMNSGSNTPPIPLLLNLARFALPALTAYALFTLIWIAFRERILSFRIRGFHDHVIICGLGRKGYFLARAYQEQNDKVVLIEKDQNNQHLQAYQHEFPRSPVLIAADACDPAILRKAGVSRAKLLISTLGQDADNFSVAEAAKKALDGSGTIKLDCKIDVSDYKMWTLFHETEFDHYFDDKNGREDFRLSFFNILESGARYEVNDLRRKKYFNPDTHPEQLGIGIINLSRFGELLILHVAREWSPSFRRQGRRISLFIWDKDIKRKVEAMCNKYPIVKDVSHIQEIELDIDNPIFNANTLSECHEDDNLFPIFVCAEDQNVCVTLSMAVMRGFRDLPVHITALLSEDKGLLAPLNSYRGVSGRAELQAVNLLEKTCKPDVLDDGTRESLARVIHETYLVNVGKDESSQPWESLDKDEQAQNLDQAFFIGSQLHSINCGITPWIEYGADSFEFTEDEIEKMAQAEHKRWMDEHFSNGWKYDPVRNDARKNHPCLVQWTDLPNEEKDKDRNTVKQIPRYLAKAGFQIYRMR